MIVIYASKTGNTRKIAQYIAEKTGSALTDLKKDSPDLSAHDVVVFGSGVYAGRPSKAVKKFVLENSGPLSGKKVAFFLSCMFDDDKGAEQLNKITSDFPFVSLKAFFPGKQKDMSDVDRFIDSLKTI